MVISSNSNINILVFSRYIYLVIRFKLYVVQFAQIVIKFIPLTLHSINTLQISINYLTKWKYEKNEKNESQTHGLKSSKEISGKKSLFEKLYKSEVNKVLG